MWVLTRKSGLLLAVGVLGALSVAAPAAAQNKKPNILFVVSDDTGYGDLGPYGGGEGRGMPTPNIDRLAASGLRFTNAHTTSATCTPSRFSLMTGVTMQHVPYKGGGPALIDVVGGHVQLLLVPPATTIPFIKSGKLKTVPWEQVRAPLGE